MIPVLPIIDFLILAGTGSLLVGSALKLVALLTSFHPAILGLSSTDFLMVTGTFFGLALVLAARSWVQVNEHQLLASQMWPHAVPDAGEEVEPLVARSADDAGDGGLDPATGAAGVEGR